ncbi:hypothetical protein HS041_36080 [Planomonospora sp. ID67723]|uniref:hypothetical protein n=1 Tax=Planomonospora sp. ID67723 TaxID=2738134 RepID=UPI0018C3E6DB|nr:hypothetical protein [Planomonospora sp. ID67723]MBG0833126.1 hypothetical protein [Planomonospora sp. ID67723]
MKDEVFPAVVLEVAVVRIAPPGAGASASARYRRELAADRPRMLLVCLLAAVSAAVVVGVPLGWVAAAVPGHRHRAPGRTRDRARRRLASGHRLRPGHR